MLRVPGAQVIVNYGASWCLHCHELFPHFYLLAKQVTTPLTDMLSGKSDTSLGSDTPCNTKSCAIMHAS